METRRKFDPAEHIRADWGIDHVTDMLERRAAGYGGLLRELFCTTAAMIREQRKGMLALATLAEDHANALSEQEDEAQVQAEHAEMDRKDA